MSRPLHSAEQAAGLANPTEARAGAHVVGIPEGGRFAHLTARSAEGSLPPADQQAPQGRAVVLELTEEQRAHLSFAALNEATSLKEGHEAHEPEVQAAIRCLWEVRAMLEHGRPA